MSDECRLEAGKVCDCCRSSAGEIAKLRDTVANRDAGTLRLIKQLRGKVASLEAELRNERWKSDGNRWGS